MTQKTKRANSPEARLRRQVKSKDQELAARVRDIAERDARLEAARDLWQATRTDLVAVRDLHSAVERGRGMGRSRGTALYCRACLSDLYPCQTVRRIDRILIRLETK